MRALNGIINFSGGEFGIGDEAFSIGDIAVSVAVEPKDVDKANVTVKLVGLSIDPQDEITINDDGSVTFDNSGGGGGDDPF